MLREQMLSCGGLSEDMLAYPDWVEAALTLTRGDLRLCASRVHTPAGPMPWPVEAFHGAGDPLVAEREAAAWAEHSNGEFGLHRLPGGHFFLVGAASRRFAARVGAAVLRPVAREGSNR
ncbi:hypothetical protein GCM10022232_92280 [Streptomyces plumbiresistens]|uniref:Thioesterase domain-containing protein n=1 Tax=Streptomyces plumbiresistens TaxID=511811 RepID=A0ABP7TW09_9ACTN